MNIQQLNEELDKLLEDFVINEMSISRQEYGDINLKPEKIIQALEKLKEKLVPWPMKDGSKKSNYSINKGNNSIDITTGDCSRWIQFQQLTQGRLAVIYSFCEDVIYFPKYMLKYQISEGKSKFKVIYNLHNEGLAKVISDTASNFKEMAKFKEKQLKLVNKADIKINKIKDKITTLVSKAKLNKLKSIEAESNFIRAIQIKPVKRPYCIEKPIIGVAVDKYGDLKFHNTTYGWCSYEEVFRDKLGTDADTLQQILDNLTVVIGEDKGGNALNKEQKRQEEAKKIAYSSLSDIKYAMKRISYGDRWGNIEENGKNCYEFEVRYWGDWEGDDGSGDYDWQTLSSGSKKELVKILDKYNIKYKKYGIKFSYSTSEKNWLTVYAEW